mmetsp:Transcript_50411/g.126299  ORF Transcript_50411/g.126299 Transcript_50411/m.126299 type:complete len:284 (-) Transcript_50411:984-1835(-)
MSEQARPQNEQEPSHKDTVSGQTIPENINGLHRPMCCEGHIHLFARFLPFLHRTEMTRGICFISCLYFMKYASAAPVEPKVAYGWWNMTTINTILDGSTGMHAPPLDASRMRDLWKAVLHQAEETDLPKVQRVIYAIPRKLPSPTSRDSFPFFIWQRNDYISNAIRARGSWEDCDTHLDLINKMQRKYGMAPHRRLDILEIGGNIGMCALTFAAAGQSVVTFEPVPENYLMLLANLKLNPDLAQRITLYPVGVGEFLRNANIYRPRERVPYCLLICAVALLCS